MTEHQYKGYKIEGVGKGKADYYVYTELCLRTLYSKVSDE